MMPFSPPTLPPRVGAVITCEGEIGGGERPSDLAGWVAWLVFLPLFWLPWRVRERRGRQRAALDALEVELQRRDIERAGRMHDRARRAVGPKGTRWRQPRVPWSVISPSSDFRAWDRKGNLTSQPAADPVPPIANIGGPGSGKVPGGDVR
jgi:hypothetical protein